MRVLDSASGSALEQMWGIVLARALGTLLVLEHILSDPQHHSSKSARGSLGTAAHQPAVQPAPP